MKKILNNLVYDTETATLIGVAVSSVAIDGSPLWKESLYRKKTGEFFLYAEGTSESRYAIRKNGAWIEGHSFIPLPYKEANEWCKRWIGRNEYKKIFTGGSDKRKAFNITLPEEMIVMIRDAAAKNCISPSAYIEEVMRENG